MNNFLTVLWLKLCVFSRSIYSRRCDSEFDGVICVLIVPSSSFRSLLYLRMCLVQIQTHTWAPDYFTSLPMIFRWDDQQNPLFFLQFSDFFWSHYQAHLLSLTAMSFSAGLLSPLPWQLCYSPIPPSPVALAPVLTVSGVNYEVCADELDGHPCGSSLCGQEQSGPASCTTYWSHVKDHGYEQCNGYDRASGRIWAGKWFDW